MKATGALSRVVAVDGVLPARAMRDLRRQITREELRGETIWYPLSSPPRTLYEQVIQRLRALVPHPETFVGAEWWARALKSDHEFHLHFDRDEAIRETVVSPDLGSILYLSDVGGPTLIFGATPASRARPKAGVAVHTRPGRFAMFPGDLLHGVLPGGSSRWPRITMLVNWWRFAPRYPSRKIPARILRTSPLAHAPALDTEPTRPREPPQAFDASRLIDRDEWVDILGAQTRRRTPPK